MKSTDEGNGCAKSSGRQRSYFHVAKVKTSFLLRRPRYRKYVSSSADGDGKRPIEGAVETLKERFCSFSQIVQYLV